MDISIVARTKDDLGVLDFVDHVLHSADEIVFELIVVDSSNQIEIPYPLDRRLKVIKTQDNRFQARIRGIRNAIADYCILLDSDQRIECGLLNELVNSGSELAVIPERSFNKNLMGRLLDFQRSQFESFGASQDFPPTISVIPRFYKTSLLERLISKQLDSVFHYGLSHEDSILYSLLYSPNVKPYFSRKRILNVDPSLSDYIRKSFLYGRFAKETTLHLEHYPEIVDLVRVINRNFIALNLKRPSLGVVPFLLRAVPYLIGYKF